jgi:hypothetical protein
MPQPLKSGRNDYSTRSINIKSKSRERTRNVVQVRGSTRLTGKLINTITGSREGPKQRSASSGNAASTVKGNLAVM